MSHSHDAGKKRFRKLVETSIESAPRLPMVHTTDSYIFVDVLDSGQLSPQDCPVFLGEKLTYLFYGRPAFRPNIDESPTSLKHFFPVCLIFKPNWSAKIHRIFPFDSGAFNSGLYGTYLHSRMKLGDFGLEPNLSTPGKLVSLFFGTVPAYLSAKPQSSPVFDPEEFEASSYLAMIHSKEGNAIDSRGSGIEIQMADQLPLAEVISAVILPSTFADGETCKRLKDLKIDPLPYKLYERTRPNEFMSQITDICFRYYLDLGLIAEGDL